MTDLRKAAEMALEALEEINEISKQPMGIPLPAEIDGAMDALRQALAEPTWDASAPLVMTPHPAFAQNPLDIADRAYFAGKQAGIEETLAQGEQDTGIDRGAWSDVPDATKWVDELRGDDESEQEPVAYFDSSVLQVPAIHRGSGDWVTEMYSIPMGNCTSPLYAAPPSKPDDLLRQSEQEGWRWAKECEAEVKRLRALLAEGGQGCCECGVTVSEGYALYCVKCVEPLFKKEWVSLTDDDIALLRRQGAHSVSDKHFKAIEALLKEKNT